MTSKISISNIAWPHHARDHVYQRLTERGVPGIEFALTKVAPWSELTSVLINDERERLAVHGLSVTSYQAVLFGLNHLQLLGDQTNFNELVAHLKMVAQYAEQLSGGGVAVFGAPRNRLLNGYNPSDAFDLGTERFFKIAEAVKMHNLTIVLEPAPPEYNGEFLVHPDDCADMVESVRHPFFKLHLDTGCMMLAEAEIATYCEKYRDIIGHVHISMPYLAAVDQQTRPTIATLFTALSRVGYAEWAAIEMRESEDYLAAIDQALATVVDGAHKGV